MECQEVVLEPLSSFTSSDLFVFGCVCMRQSKENVLHRDQTVLQCLASFDIG